MAQEQSCSGWLMMSFYTNATEADIVKCLRESANIDASSPDGLTPLFRATQAERFENVDRLVELGADINTRNAWGLDTPALGRHEWYARNCQTFDIAGKRYSGKG